MADGDNSRPSREGKPIAASTKIVAIAEMAEAYDVSQRTLRFYEHRGLLSPRRVDGMRFYGEAERRRLETILRCKAMGFTLTEITALLRGPAKGPGEFSLETSQVVEQIAHLQRQRERIDAQIAQLMSTLTNNGAK